MTGIRDIEVGRIGVHALDFLPHGVGVVGEIDTVAETLAHLFLTVGTGQTACSSVLRQHDLRLHEHGRIDLVEAVDQFAGELQHWFLIFAGRYGGSLKGSDVGSL